MVRFDGRTEKGNVLYAIFFYTTKMFFVFFVHVARFIKTLVKA